jgi:hypothetical protein
MYRMLLHNSDWIMEFSKPVATHTSARNIEEIVGISF